MLLTKNNQYCRNWGGSNWHKNTHELYWVLLPADDADLYKPFINLYHRNLLAEQKVAKDVLMHSMPAKHSSGSRMVSPTRYR
jgi:hypothetical protein